VCKEFIEKVVIKSWNERLRGLEFCGRGLAELEREIHDVEKTKIDRAGVDLSFDPYAIRDLENAREMKLLNYNNLKNLLSNEKRIESIIEGRSREIITDYCGVSELVNDFINKDK
jgi:hypothetical protein